MKAIFLVKYGKADEAFEWRDIEISEPGPDEVAIETEAAGINFADVVARLGNYRDAPPLPFIPGYEVVGRINAVGKNVKELAVGQRVLAFTRFGGYSQYICQKVMAVAAIPDEMPAGEALSLATQYCTAYYSSHIATNVMPGDRVLVQAGAGGVGTALIQLCKLRGAFVYATVGSDEKIKYAKKQGADVVINYRKEDFSKAIQDPIDLAFDAVGGHDFRKCYKLLNRGGRLVGYGASTFTDATNILDKANKALSFGIYHPAELMMECRSIIGINMLRIADYRPDLLQYSMKMCIQLYSEGKIHPQVGGMYNARDVARAHEDMEKRRTMGKIGLIF